MTTTVQPRPGAPVPKLRHNRGFLLLWSGTAVSLVGLTVSTVAYPLLILAATGSKAAAGVVGFFSLLPALLFQLPAGALIDRWDRRRLMIWCDVVRAVGAASVVLALALDELTVAHVVVVGFVEGTMSVFFNLAAHAAVPNIVHPDHLSAALSRNEARSRAATMLGTTLGGILFGLSRVMPFLLHAVTHVISLVTLLFIRADFQSRQPARARTTGLLAEVGEGMRWLWCQPFLRTAALLVAGSNLLFRALFLVVVVMATDVGASPAAVGVLLGVAGAGGVLGSLVAGWCQRWVPLPALVVGANWIWALLMGAIVVADNLYLLTAAYAGMWFVGPLWNVAVATHQLRITPDRLRGRVLGAMGLLASGALPIGALIGGLLLEWFDARAAALVLAGWMVLLALVATFVPALRRPVVPVETTTVPDAEPAVR
ncbi:MFS transporter [Salinispora sp. H7-4]|uniref:MFS transporter n=1 Tax=Salinispora sp. H7-4 TaxID=2748321 RepID=UPI0015D1BCE2|nr:MFS transporter [Salinispora sp. H7-4]NYT94928.1 MFS transporter [Salinispora sp. H7-4]